MVNKFSGASHNFFASREAWIIWEFGGHPPMPYAWQDGHKENVTFEGIDELGHEVY